jgi:hypothetical protein
MRKIVRTFPFFSCFIITALLLNACGLIFTGTHDKVQFNSNPGDSEVYIDGQYRGQTPMKLELRADQDYVVEFKKEGYETRSITINYSVGAGFVILDILGGLVPVIIDAASGGWYMLDQTTVGVALRENETSSLDVEYLYEE